MEEEKIKELKKIERKLARKLKKHEKECSECYIDEEMDYQCEIGNELFKKLCEVRTKILMLKYE
jgi:hypothetical protein